MRRVTHVRGHRARSSRGRRYSVRPHRMEYRTRGPPTFVVVYRRKEMHGRTPRRPHFTWHTRGPYPDRRAEQVRRGLMARGFHAVVERYGGGRTVRRPTRRALVRQTRSKRR
jgi:hypothetical protein